MRSQTEAEDRLVGSWYQLPRAAKTNFHKLCDLEQQKFIALEVRSLKSKISADYALSEGSSGGHFLGLWNHNSNLCLCLSLHFVFKMPCSFILFVFLFSEKGILHWVQGLLAQDDLILRFPIITSAKNFVPKKSHSEIPSKHLLG